jgi:hypothetical protein
MVEKQIRVVLYGSSLFLAGIEGSLRAEPGLEVVHIQPGSADKCLLREVMDASLLAFEVHEASPELMRALLKEAPHLALLALDPESDRLLVLSGRASGARTTGDLTQVIRRHAEQLSESS